MARKSRKNVETVAILEPKRVFYNAAAYTRLSSDDKIKPGDSLKNQYDIIENFVAAAPDIRIVETYTDNSATGTNFDRPAFQRMLSDAQSGRINCIIVKDLSRFGRNAIDAGYYIEKYLPALGVRFIAVTDSFDSNNDDGGILLPLKNLIAESYALDISRKCKSVQRQNIRDGRFVGRMAPYGYAKDPEDCHHLVVDPEAAAVVRQIFHWAEDGMGAGEIVRLLNENGVLPPSRYKWEKGLITNEKLLGKRYWEKRAVAGILADQVYIGDMVQGKSRTIRGKETLTAPSEWVCVENTHEPILSRNQYKRVQDLLKQAAQRDAAVRSDAVPYSSAVFNGKVFCAHCGHPMHRHRQNKDGIYWYRCESQWKYHKGACYQVSVKEAELKTAVMDVLRENAASISGGTSYLERESGGAMSEVCEARLREISRQLQSNGRYLKSLYENMVSGVIMTEEFTSMKADYEAKIEALSRQADELRQQRREREAAIHEANDMAYAVSRAVHESKLTAEVVDKLVEKILVSRDKSFEIQLHCCDGFEEVKQVG